VAVFQAVAAITVKIHTIENKSLVDSIYAEGQFFHTGEDEKQY